MPLASLKGALQDVRVLDLSRVLAGPFCTQTLGDLGAVVIKVEQPGEGDETRAWGPPFTDGLSAYFLSCNRNKKSIAIDLKSAEGQLLIKDILRRSDIVVENFRADSRLKLGLTPQQLHQINPKLIICSISGYGATDAAMRPGYDYVIQGMSGMMAMNGPVDGEPHKFGVAIADIVTGLYATTAILSALHARKTSGEGYAIDLALLDCAVAAQANVVQAFLSTGKQPRRQGHGHMQIVPYQLFKASDGFLILAVGNDRQWQAFCEVAGAHDLEKDTRFKQNSARVRLREELVPIVAALVKSKTVSEWQRLLAPAKIPHGPVWNFEDLFASEDAKRAGLKIVARSASGKTIDLVRSPLLKEQQAILAPPALGAHTELVLNELLGMRPDEIANLRLKGIIA